LVKAIADHGQEVWFHNTILLFTMLAPGPIFAAALGCFFDKRRMFAVIGFFAQIPVFWWWGPAGS
jgi:hypothetical protein